MARPKKEETQQAYTVTPMLANTDMSGKPMPHVLDGMELPEFKAISLVRVGKTNDWAPVILTIKDGRVTDMEAGEPNMWQVAVDVAKIEFVRNFMRQEAL